MLALFLCWLAMFRASCALGSRLCRGVFDEDGEWFPAFWTGFLILSSIALAVACFTPLTPWVAAALLAPPLLIWRQPPAAPRSFWIVLAAMTYTSSSAERLYDTGLYHRQLIDWMARDGLVPGLGILHYRLGFSSSWLAWPAFFDHGPLYARMGSAATGLALASIVAHWIQCAVRCRTLADRFFVAGAPLLCAYFLSESMIVSPSPNLGAGCAAFVILWMLLSPGAAHFALLAAGAAATLKISAAILIPACLWRTRRMLAPALLLMLPLLLANWRTTGCPIFPSPAGCTETAATLGKETAREVEFETRNWARYVGHYPRDAKFWSLDWFPRWISSERNQLQFGAAMASLLLLTIRRQWDACATAAAAGFAYVFLLAPDFRFGVGFLTALPGRALAGFRFTLPRIPAWPMAAAAVVVIVTGSRIGEHVSNKTLPDSRLSWTNARLLAPVRAWSPAAPPRFWKHDGSISIPPSVDDRCGAIPRPCAPEYAPRHGMRLCDPSRSWRGGFCRAR